MAPCSFTENKSIQFNNTLLDLPDEILIKIFEYCDDKTRSSLACSCKKLLSIAKDEVLQIPKTALLIGLKKINDYPIRLYIKKT